MCQLQLESLEIHYTDESGASEKTVEEVCPGHPFIIFSAKPSVSVVLENPLPRSGLFTITNDVTNGETTKQFNEKIAKIVGLKGIIASIIWSVDEAFITLFVFSGVDALRIWRFEDPVLGPRKIPVCSEPFKGKIKLEDGVFTIDTEKNEIILELENSQKINVGTSFMYVVE